MQNINCISTINKYTVYIVVINAQRYNSRICVWELDAAASSVKLMAS